MRTVLIIDDNPAVAHALQLLFSLHDIRTLAALTPEKGLALLSREPIDLVIGWDFCGSISARPRFVISHARPRQA